MGGHLWLRPECGAFLRHRQHFRVLPLRVHPGSRPSWRCVLHRSPSARETSRRPRPVVRGARTLSEGSGYTQRGIRTLSAKTKDPVVARERTGGTQWYEVHDVGLSPAQFTLPQPSAHRRRMGCQTWHHQGRPSPKMPFQSASPSQLSHRQLVRRHPITPAGKL